MSASFSAESLPLALVFFAIAVVIMWLSARIVGVSTATLSRSLIATIAISLIVGVVLTIAGVAGSVVAIGLGIGGLIACVAVLRSVFQISTMPAFLIFIVNVMVQMILMSLYLRPYLHVAK